MNACTVHWRTFRGISGSGSQMPGATPLPQKSWQPEMSLDIIKCPVGVKGLGEAKLPQLRITSKYISILYFQWGLLTIPVCPQLRGFSGCENFRSKTRWVPGNLLQLVTLTGLCFGVQGVGRNTLTLKKYIPEEIHCNTKLSKNNLKQNCLARIVFYTTNGAISSFFRTILGGHYCI